MLGMDEERILQEIEDKVISESDYTIIETKEIQWLVDKAKELNDELKIGVTATTDPEFHNCP